MLFASLGCGHARYTMQEQLGKDAELSAGEIVPRLLRGWWAPMPPPTFAEQAARKFGR